MELLLGIATVLLEFALEFALEVFGGLLLELGLRSLGEPFVAREERNAVFAAIGYVLLGLVFGFLSLLVFPDSFVRSRNFHGINLIITPLLAGLAMAGIGRLRERKGQTIIRLDSFAYGFLFAFAMASVRFFFTN
jgi:hypothetical protein